MFRLQEIELTAGQRNKTWSLILCRMIWAGHVARVVKMINANKILA
jgi:hypothetical protein